MRFQLLYMTSKVVCVSAPSEVGHALACPACRWELAARRFAAQRPWQSKARTLRLIRYSYELRRRLFASLLIMSCICDEFWDVMVWHE